MDHYFVLLLKLSIYVLRILLVRYCPHPMYEFACLNHVDSILERYRVTVCNVRYTYSCDGDDIVYHWGFLCQKYTVIVSQKLKGKH